MQITGHTFLISGGSSGLGAACARRISELGGFAVIADLAPPADADLEGDERLLFVRADVTSEVDLSAVIDAGERRFGPLRGAIACAGILRAEKLLGRDGPADLDAFRRMIDVNLTGTFNVIRLAAAAIARVEPQEDGERGVLIMTSSVAAEDGQIGQAAYSAAKGGVAAMTLPLARELARTGIRVVSIAPGVFETPMMQATPAKLRQSLVSQIPFPARFGDPDEFAALAAHVIENRMLNGCTLRIDGALRMGAT